MSTFEVKVRRVDAVELHPNADRLTINWIGGYTCISNKHEDGTARYAAGDLVVYIPEAAVLPEWLLRYLDMWDDAAQKGRLNGPAGNRIMPMKLRGIYSEGVLLPVVNGVLAGEKNSMHVSEGLDVAGYLDITKYEPPIPPSMSGQVANLFGYPIKFDVEPYEKYTDVITVGEQVVITEKCHGTFTGIGIIKGLNHPEMFMAPWGSRDIIVYSKGLGAQGLCFKDLPENDTNIYVRMVRKLIADEDFQVGLLAFMQAGVGLGGNVTQMHLLGETFGPGIQDLNYGLKEPEFRIFDLWLNSQPGGTICSPVDPHEITALAHVLFGLDMVPTLYEGPFDPPLIPKFRDGKDSISNTHVREGIVIKPVLERRDPLLGRVLLKCVSPDYKLRKGNATEFN